MLKIRAKNFQGDFCRVFGEHGFLGKIKAKFTVKNGQKNETTC
jgi:hypothetical protein